MILTFDVEDFINSRSMDALHRILRLLRKYDIRALFLITGHAAERLSNSTQKGHVVLYTERKLQELRAGMKATDIEIFCS